MQVLWDGYPASEATWEPEENLRSVRHLIKAYEQQLAHNRQPEATKKRKGTKAPRKVQEESEEEDENEEEVMVRAPISDSAQGTPFVESKRRPPSPQAKPTSDSPGLPQDLEVETIVGARIEGGRPEFHVKWKGYPNSENTWEPVHHVVPGALDVVKDFLWKLEASVKGQAKK